MRMPRGAPSKYIPQYDEAVKGLALLGCTDEEIAEAFDISVTTLNAWKARYPTFLVALRGGKIIADGRVAGSLYARATGYSHMADKIFFREGDDAPTYAPYIKHYPPETAAAIFWLKNRRKEDWRDKQEIVATRPLAGMSPKERLAAVVDLMARARRVLEQQASQEPETTDAEYEEADE